MVHGALGSAYERGGLEKQAIEEFLKSKVLTGETAARVKELRRSYEQGGMRGYWRKEVERATAQWNGWHWAATEIAWLHASLGQRDEAMRWLEKAYEARSGSLIWLSINDWQISHRHLE
jgi:tetratricopeptide (TPR) repeat protein